MTDPIQTSIPGTDVPPEPVRKKRGRPKGYNNKVRGALFADGGHDYRIYLVEDDGRLAPVAESPGFPESVSARRWLKQNGGRDDLQGHTVIVIRGIFIARLELAPVLRVKPRGKLPGKVAKPAGAPAAEPEPVSA